MSNYTPTGNPPAQTRSSSANVRNEFVAIQTAVNSKADYAGQTYSGTHDYTAGTIEVPTLPYGTTGAYAVSWDALNAAVFAATLPGVPSGALPYKLSAVSGVVGWALDTLPFLDSTALAQAHAITLSF